MCAFLTRCVDALRWISQRTHQHLSDCKPPWMLTLELSGNLPETKETHPCFAAQRGGDVLCYHQCAAGVLSSLLRRQRRMLVPMPPKLLSRLIRVASPLLL